MPNCVLGSRTNASATSVSKTKSISLTELNGTFTIDNKGLSHNALTPMAMYICLGPSSITGEDSFNCRPMQLGLKKNTVEGSPSAPCLELPAKQSWRFRWVVKSGAKRVSIKVKQVGIGSTGTRPTLTVKANPSIGLDIDTVATAPDGTDWVTIGPVVFVPNAAGVVYVEVKNNIDITTGETSTSLAYFDHIVAI